VQGHPLRPFAGALRTASLVLAGISGLAMMLPAASRASPPPSGTEKLVEISIPAQPLSNALQTFARQVGKQIVFYSDDAERLRADPIRGRYTEREALRRLLRNSGLEFTYVNERTIGIGKRDAQGRFILSFSTIETRAKNSVNSPARLIAIRNR
jgi:iron complex outermembrane receptor protein